MTGNQACRLANVRLEIFNPSGQLVHEQVFEGEVLGFRDDVMTWNLKPRRAPPYLPVCMYFESLGKTNLGICTICRSIGRSSSPRSHVGMINFGIQ